MLPLPQLVGVTDDAEIGKMRLELKQTIVLQKLFGKIRL